MKPYDGKSSYVSYDLKEGQARFAGINVDPKERGGDIATILMTVGEQVLQTMELNTPQNTCHIRKPTISSFLGKWGYQPAGRGDRLQIEDYTTEGVPRVRYNGFLRGQTSRHSRDWYQVVGEGFRDDPSLKVVTVNTGFKLVDASKHARQYALGTSCIKKFEIKPEAIPQIQRLCLIQNEQRMSG